MLRRDPDKEWEKFGKDDPYYGVMVLDKFHKQGLDQKLLAEFFASGRQHVEYIMHTIRTGLSPGFSPSRALDFGCGVGRCVVPLASMCPQVVGIDVSASMIEEARQNCVRHSLSNVELMTSADAPSQLKGTFDLIHSSFVFQHIPRDRGERIFAELVDRLSDGGIGAVDFLIHRDRPGLATTMSFLRRNVPFFNSFANLLYRKPFSEPLMEKVVYNLTPLLRILYAAGCGNVQVKAFSNDNQFDAILFFQKARDRVPHEAFFTDRPAGDPSATT